MTDEKNNPAEELKKNIKATLENVVFQNTVGANLIKSHPEQYGQLGIQNADDKYQNIMTSEDVQKIRQKSYDEKKKQGDALGVAGEPSISNYDITLKIVQQIQEVMAIAPIGYLEEIVKPIVGDTLTFKTPDELKEISYMALMQKQQSGDKLTDQEKDALKIYGLLNESYMRNSAQKIVGENYLAGINSEGEKIAKKYEKSKKKE